MCATVQAGRGDNAWELNMVVASMRKGMTGGFEFTPFKAVVPMTSISMRGEGGRGRACCNGKS